MLLTQLDTKSFKQMQAERLNSRFSAATPEKIAGRIIQKNRLQIYGKMMKRPIRFKICYDERIDI